MQEENIYKIKKHQIKLLGPFLDHDQSILYKQEKEKKSIGSIRFANLLTIFTIIFFGILDYFQIYEKEVFVKLIITRVVFIIAFIIPFFILAKTKLYTKNSATFLFLNALGYILFLLMVAWLSQNSIPALFHIYMGIIISLICIHLLIGLSQNLALLISLISIILSNILILSLHLNAKIPTLHLNVNVWFIISTTLAYFFGLYFDSNAKLSFLINLKLKEENELKNKFFSIVAHDLKNMIASQYSITEYLMDQHTQISENKRDEMLKILNQSSIDVLDVFEDLMQWIKSQLSSITIHKQKASLQKSISSIISLMEHQTTNKNISIEQDSEEDNAIITDLNLLSLVLKNILGNALKFSHPGNTIKIKSTLHQNVWEIQVIDHGIGMSQITIDRIFKLERVDSQKGTSGETGTGLGMILSKELIGILDGELIINSKLNKGTVITILLPNG